MEVVTTTPPSDLLALDPNGCARPPGYRWELARRHAAGEYVPDGWVDHWVVLAAELLTAPPGGVRGRPDLEAVAAARALAATDWPRVAVETRLLAGESFAVIAAKQGLTPAAVAAYEALYYAVTDRLSAKSYISHVAVGLNSHRDTDPWTHVRALGYSGGPLMADSVIDAFTMPPPGPDAPPDVRRLHRQVRLAVGLRTTPVTPATYGRWARLHFLQLEHDARVGRGECQPAQDAGCSRRGFDARGHFYRTRRVGKRVVREYFGAGPLAEVAADLADDLRRARAAEAARAARLDAAAPPLRTLGVWLDLAAAAHLLAAGYYRHARGPWRKRRVD